MYKYLLLALTIVIFSCNLSPEIQVLPDNAKQLISGETSKQWKLSKKFNRGYRMNMEGCFLSYVITYHADGTFSDNNSKFQGCGESLEGTWDLVINEDGNFLKLTSAQIPDLMGIDEEYKMMKILRIEDLELQLQFTHNKYKKMGKMVDHLVPIELKVADRAFQH